MTVKQVPRFDEDRMPRQEAADYLGLSYNTLKNWAVTGNGDLPYHKVGSRVYYRRSELDAWLEVRKQTRTPF